jgi:hypothetical protein
MFLVVLLGGRRWCVWADSCTRGFLFSPCFHCTWKCQFKEGIFQRRLCGGIQTADNIRQFDFRVITIETGVDDDGKFCARQILPAVYSSIMAMAL